MYIKTILWFVILVNFTPLNAQQNYSDFKVNFNVDEYILDNSDKETLDALIQEAKSGGYYEITLTAHTDNDGSNAYNIALSNKRAESVKDYLISGGLKGRVMDVEWFGEARPEASNTSTVGKSINRRVVVSLKKYRLNNVGDVIKTSGGDFKQQFRIRAGKDNTITGKKGTKVFLPKDALVTKDGKPVPAEDVTIELQEFQTSHDAIFNQLSTISNGQVLESGGMFTIVAKYNGEELKLKDGKSMDIEMPSSNMKNDMQVFVGVKNSEGITEWQPTSKPFAVKSANNVNLPYVNLDVEMLENLKQSVEADKPGVIQKQYEMHLGRHIPVLKGRPALKAYPTEEERFTFFERIFYSKQKRERILQEECTAVDRYNKRKLDRYEEYVKRHEKGNVLYMEDVIAQSNFYKWAKDQLEVCREHIAVYEKMGFNIALDNLIRQSNANEVKSAVSNANLMRDINYGENEKAKMLELYRMEYQLNNMLNMPYFEIVARYAPQGVLDLDRVNTGTSNKVSDNDFTNRLLMNVFANRFCSDNKELQAMFKTSNMELYEKRSKLGLTDMATVSNVYTTSITGFGSINCDRFSSTPPDQMVNITIECNSENSQISFFIPSINSYLYAYRKDNTYEVKLPEGVKATMVVVGLDNGTPLFAKEKVEIKRKMKLAANPQPSTLKQIQKEVASI